MKKTNFLPIWAGLSITVVLVVLTFFWQFKSNKQVRKIFKEKKLELQEAQKASRRLEQMEKQSQELKLKGESLAKRIPLGEKTPLNLIKVITRLAMDIGLKNLKFDLKSASSADARTNINLPADLSALYFGMEAEATYPQLVDFLTGLMNLERVVTVEKVEIKRDETKYPYQVIALSLAAYSFKE
jgi:Tfp pilus assembly protein PilO